jgi:hypothetical protein
MYTLMKEPVKLPSGAIVDLATIKSHLLSDATDPFTRTPLRIEEVMPGKSSAQAPSNELRRDADHELKSKIARYLSSRKSSGLRDQTGNGDTTQL